MEQWLLLGASRWEATQSLIQKATIAALAPTLSHISVMGLVTIPSTMSGQLLGGTAPIQVKRLTVQTCAAMCSAFERCCCLEVSCIGQKSFAAVYSSVLS